MRRFAFAPLRITLVVLAVIALAALAIRQPVLTSLPWAGDTRANPELLRRHVAFLTGQANPRDARHPEQLDAVAAYIARVFRESGGRVEIQPFDARGRRYRNVIARFGPEDGAPLVVGAHYDVFCAAGGHCPGADDNASGVAGLLELARLAGRAKVGIPLVLVAYSTEEPPFFGSESMGSAVHARSLPAIRGMICLEMIGYYTNEQLWPNWLFELLYPSHGNFIGVAGRWRDRALTRYVARAIRGAGGVGVCMFTGPRETLDASDQRNYWERGWTAVLVTDTAYLRNPNYHTARDTAGTLDYERMARVTDGVLNAVLHAE